MHMIRSLPLLFVGLFLSAPLQAADHDAQIWTSANVSVDVSKKIVVTMEAVGRFTDNASRTGQTILRPSIGYKLGKNTTASLGYARVFTDPVGPAETRENRMWQQMAFRIAGDGKGLTVTGRTRLEQRWFEGRNDMGWRLRQQVRATLPVSGNVRGFVWSEAFLSIDDTSWGQRSGLDRWRNAAGLTVPINKAIAVEPGYINQWVSVRGTDRVHHIGNVTLTAKF